LQQHSRVTVEVTATAAVVAAAHFSKEGIDKADKQGNKEVATNNLIALWYDL
jgi:hypothetical protein